MMPEDIAAEILLGAALLGVAAIIGGIAFVIKFFLRVEKFLELQRENIERLEEVLEDEVQKARRVHQQLYAKLDTVESDLAKMIGKMEIFERRNGFHKS